MRLEVSGEREDPPAEAAQAVDAAGGEKVNYVSLGPIVRDHGQLSMITSIVRGIMLKPDERKRHTVVKRYPEGDRPYLDRYFIGDQRGAERYFAHRFHRGDPEAALHDHPWDFATLILVGGYLEHTPDATIERRAGDLVTHKAEDLHRIELTTTPTWTLVRAGPTRRTWGFMEPSGWRAYERI